MNIPLPPPAPSRVVFLLANEDDSEVNAPEISVAIWNDDDNNPLGNKAVPNPLLTADAEMNISEMNEL